MASSKETARCNPEPPALNSSKEMLQHLLTVELDRLEVARRIEKERDIVFPETTVIIRDIQKLHAAIEGYAEAEDDADDLDAMLNDL